MAGARLAAWHSELAASSRGWGRGVSRGTRCGRTAGAALHRPVRFRVTPRGRRRLWEVSRRWPPGLPISGRSGGAGYLLGNRDLAEPILQSQERGAPAWRRRISNTYDVKGSGRWAAAAGRAAGGPAPQQSCLFGSESGLREALHCSIARPRPLTSPLTFSPSFCPPPQPCPLAPLRDAFARVRN